MQVAEDYAKNEISAKATVYWNNLSVDDRFDTCDEYISKYGYLLPSELTEGSAARIKGAFLKVLEAHTNMMLRLHGVGK
jgi:hypothetical protein